MTLDQLIERLIELRDEGRGQARVLASLHSDSSSWMDVEGADAMTRDDAVQWLTDFGDDYGFDWDPDGLDPNGYVAVIATCEIALTTEDD